MIASFLRRAKSHAGERRRHWIYSAASRLHCLGARAGPSEPAAWGPSHQGLHVTSCRGPLAPRQHPTELSNLAAEATWHMSLLHRFPIGHEVVSSVSLPNPTISKTLIINSNPPSLPPLAPGRQRGVHVCLNHPDNCLFSPPAWACSGSIDLTYHQEVVAPPLISLILFIIFLQE